LACSRRVFSALLSTAEEYPDLPIVTPTPAKIGKTSITKLDSGLIVVSEDASVTSTVSLTFPSGGSSAEALGESGAAFANKLFAFKSAGGMSSVAILRAVENEGGKPFTCANRYTASVGFTSAPDKSIDLMGAVLSSTSSSFEKWDVREATTLAKKEISIANKNPEVMLNEAIYASAFGAQTPMGRPFYSACSDKSLVSFRASNYVLDGAVLAGTGVNHEDFTAEAVSILSDLGVASKSPATNESKYLGGESRVAMPTSGYAYVALSMAGPTDSPVLLSVLKHCYALSGVSAFASPGLVGVYGSSAAAGAGALTDSLRAAVGATFSSAIIKNAKAAAKAEAIYTAEGGSKGLADLMSTSVMYTGSFCIQSLGAAYDGISEKDVHDAVAGMKTSGISLAAVGEISGVPYLGSISA